MDTLNEAIRCFLETLAAHPERDALAADEAAYGGVGRRYPVLALSHLADPLDASTAASYFELPEHAFPDTWDGRVAQEILGLLRPLDMLNPVAAVLSAGGPGSPADLIPCFGIPVSDDGGAAAHTCSLAAMLHRPPPDPETAGLMPEFKARIGRLKALTPPAFKIAVPNLQGPFNLVHAMISDEAFTAPQFEPDQFQRFIGRVTDFWIAAYEQLTRWIGPERLSFADRIPLLAECSVNLVSADFYREHILPHDLRIARHFGAVRIHPCVGRHVFHVTLQELPRVVATEAGQMLSPMAAPWIGVDEALETIGDRPVLLSIGQELPADRDAAFDLICCDLDRQRGNSRLKYTYTGMSWRKRDRPMIRELHRQLDEYWDRHVRNQLG